MVEPLRIMALHALGYCERLFYLEEVENLRVADERVLPVGVCTLKSSVLRTRESG